MEYLLNLLSEYGFDSEEQTDGSIIYTLDDDGDIYRILYHQKSKFIYVEFQVWPLEILHTLMKVGKTEECQVLFSWHDERLEWILHEVESEIQDNS